MIKNIRDEKVTPKQKAEEIIIDAIQCRIDTWKEHSIDTDGLTDREIAIVEKQLYKIHIRLKKVLHQ